MRTALPRDEARVAALHAAREGVSEDAARERVQAWAGAPGRDLVVAEHRGAVHGYARSELRDLSGTPDADATGWHLVGVVVAPGARRRGLGLELTRARLARLAGRTDRAWCVVNARNGASLDLHLRVGFVEVRRAPVLTGIRFSGGDGVLLRCDLDGRR